MSISAKEIFEQQKSQCDLEIPLILQKLKNYYQTNETNHKIENLVEVERSARIIDGIKVPIIQIYAKIPYKDHNALITFLESVQSKFQSKIFAINLNAPVHCSCHKNF